MYEHAPENYVCPFCLLARGEFPDWMRSRPEDVIVRGETATAFIAADCFGLNRGHVLIIPNAHYENIYSLPDGVSARVHALEREVALALKAVYRCGGVSSRQHNEPCGNQDVWHYHLHVFPRYPDDRLYRAEKRPLPPRERAVCAQRLRAWFSSHSCARTSDG